VREPQTWRWCRPGWQAEPGAGGLSLGDLRHLAVALALPAEPVALGSDGLAAARQCQQQADARQHQRPRLGLGHRQGLRLWRQVAGAKARHVVGQAARRGDASSDVNLTSFSTSCMKVTGPATVRVTYSSVAWPMFVPRIRSAKTTGTVASKGWEMVSSLIDARWAKTPPPSPIEYLTISSPTPIWAEST
jgi:hypothetical protein